nr:hypothetical protein [Tanacetum cinerariifolium]
VPVMVVKVLASRYDFLVYMWFRYVVSLVCWCSLCHEAIVKERFGEAVFIIAGNGRWR